MKSRIVFICVLITTLLALPLWSQLTTGPVSPYYIVSLGGIYVVQGTNPVWSFPTVYGGDENVLAITCAWTSSCTSVFGTGSIHTRTDGFGPGQNDGEYALSGTQTGVSYYVPPGLVTYDGTSDGLHNY